MTILLSDILGRSSECRRIVFLLAEAIQGAHLFVAGAVFGEVGR